MSEFPDQFKIHETEADRERQHAVLKEFTERFNLEFVETAEEERAPIDARLFRNGAYYAVSDAKYRNTSYDFYPTYTVDVEKVDTLIQQAEQDAVKAFLLVSWKGDTRYLNLSKITENWDSDDCLFPISAQKRTDRDELPDRVYHIPLDLFRKVDRVS
jgi:hypothetical protein